MMMGPEPSGVPLSGELSRSRVPPVVPVRTRPPLKLFAALVMFARLAELLLLAMTSWSLRVAPSVTCALIGWSSAERVNAST